MQRILTASFRIRRPGGMCELQQQRPRFAAQEVLRNLLYPRDGDDGDAEEGSQEQLSATESSMSDRPSLATRYMLAMAILGNYVQLG